MIRKYFLLSFIFISHSMFAAEFQQLDQHKFSQTVWDWANIDTKDIAFPKDFLWGAAICAYQNGIKVKSTWSDWAETSFPDGTTHIDRGEKFDISKNNHFEDYKKDIDLMKELNLNSFRTEIFWPYFEPTEGQFNEEARRYYHQYLDDLIAAGIQPLITMNHFDIPVWFAEKGGFEKEENIQYFVNFCKEIFKEYGSKVRWWCTINEPTVYVFQGYMRDVFPPGKKGPRPKNIIPNQEAATVLRNLMQAHTEVYLALKAMPNGKQAQIGAIHQYLKFVPYGWNPAEKVPGFLLNGFLNDCLLNFYQTGRFEYKSRILGINATYQAPTNKLMDWFGLNYYSQVVVALRPGHPPASCLPGQIMTDMEYAIFAEGLYHAIKDVSRIGAPIIITENGISDKNKDDWRRRVWLEQYLYAVSKAISEGYKVIGYYYWTLIKNFEWNMGYGQDFGLFGHDRILRNGAKYYKQVIEAARSGALSNRRIVASKSPNLAK